MQIEDRQEISETLKLLTYNKTKYQDMLGEKIYGNMQKVEKKNLTGMTYQLSNETGHGEITVYRVFTGIELYYNDMHMRYCNQNQTTAKNMIEINHCLIGRFECSFGENSCCYMAEGDLSISSMMKKKSNSCFPLNHYHGISIIINLDELLPEIRQIMELLNIGGTSKNIYATATGAVSCVPIRRLNIFFQNSIMSGKRENRGI